MWRRGCAGAKGDCIAGGAVDLSWITGRVSLRTARKVLSFDGMDVIKPAPAAKPPARQQGGHQSLAGAGGGVARLPGPGQVFWPGAWSIRSALAPAAGSRSSTIGLRRLRRGRLR